MLKPILLSLALCFPIAANQLKTFFFNETFICNIEIPSSNWVTVRVCEKDYFGEECSESQTGFCGSQCSFTLKWADTGDEWPGTEFEIYVEFQHKCDNDGITKYKYPGGSELLDYPIDGLSTRHIAHEIDLANYQGEPDMFEYY